MNNRNFKLSFINKTGNSEELLGLNFFKASKTNIPYYMMFDIKTITLANGHSRIVLLAWVILDEKFGLIKEESFYLNPGKPIPEAVVASHHITDEIVKQYAKPHVEIFAKFYADLNNIKWLIAYNYWNYVHIIGSETKKIKSILTNIPFVDTYRYTECCTMREGHSYCNIPFSEKRYNSLTLERLAVLCGLNITNAYHDVLCNALTTAKCFEVMVRDNHIKTGDAMLQIDRSIASLDQHLMQIKEQDALNQKIVIKGSFGDNFTAFDFETSSHDRMPCQLGIVVVRNGEIVEEKCWLIQPPENKYDSHFSKIHGITAKKTCNCQEFDALWPEIRPYFDQEKMVAHNVSFDRTVLETAIAHYKLEKVHVKAFLCTSTILGKVRLDNAATQLGIDIENHHNALCDARVCAQICIVAAKSTDSAPPEETHKRAVPVFYLDKNRSISKDAKIQDLSIVKNTDTIFYKKRVVISGVFESFPVRNDLALLLKKLGTDVNGALSKRTDLLIIGDDFGPKKMGQAEQIIAAGYPLKIMNEEDLIRELNSINTL
ncbi:MAG: hypothetical protein LBS16_08060 [Prevotellaceae bacterium]|nr:hypothetical protein [Prevotellaceae bacterium]